MVVQKVADVGGVDAGEQDEDSLLMVGSSSLIDRDISDSLAPQMSLLPMGVEEGRVGVVARQVGLTVDGVNYHLGRLCRRLDAPNRVALVARAYVLGLLDPRAWPPAQPTAHDRPTK
jgi:hypothetical protein